MSEGALDRGLFTTTVYKTAREEVLPWTPLGFPWTPLHPPAPPRTPPPIGPFQSPSCVLQEKKNQAELKQEEFRKPSDNTTNIKANYNAIDENGLPIRGRKVVEGDVLIGKVIPVKPGADDVQRFRDVSHVVEVGNGGIVDEVIHSINGDGYAYTTLGPVPFGLERSTGTEPSLPLQVQVLQGEGAQGARAGRRRQDDEPSRPGPASRRFRSRFFALCFGFGCVSDNFSLCVPQKGEEAGGEAGGGEGGAAGRFGVRVFAFPAAFVWPPRMSDRLTPCVPQASWGWSFPRRTCPSTSTG